MGWIERHLGETVVFGVIALSTIIQISPIRINPWSWVAQKIGKAFNADTLKGIESTRQEIEAIKDTLTEHIADDNDRFAKQCRLRILRFNDEILQGIRHTKEHYDEILDDVTAYERHCDLNPGYRNSKAEMAIRNVETKYQEHLAEKDFL